MEYRDLKKDRYVKKDEKPLYEEFREETLEKVCLNTGISGGSDQCC